MIVVSAYYPDLNPDVVAAQKAVIAPMCEALGYGMVHAVARDHATAMTDVTRHYAKARPDESLLWLDIDAIPLSIEALRNADNGAFHGAMQRANHIDNDRHLYVGPFCMHLPLRLYRHMGRPDFAATHRGDVGEELTYVAENMGIAPVMSPPVHVERPMWDLRDGLRFGIGTTYANGFFHNFNARHADTQASFIAKCHSTCTK